VFAEPAAPSGCILCVYWRVGAIESEDELATQSQALTPAASGLSEKTRPIGGLRFDWIAVFFACWLIVGLYIDGWAHAHGKADTTFFTPWHAILYSGFALSALVLMATMVINRARTGSWVRAMPSGYGAALLGVAIFALGGVGDLIWHTLFGIEVTIDALLSPTHLLLAFGGSLIMTGPFYAAWQRAESGKRGSLALLPMLLSVTAFLSVLTFFTNFGHPLVKPLANKAYAVQPVTNSLLYTMRPDGSNQTRLINTAHGSYADLAISPDGSQIAYIWMVTDAWHLQVADADGSNPSQLTREDLRPWQPSWSPDGKQIVFGSSRDNSDIYVINADGRGLKNLTGDEQPTQGQQSIAHERPSFSPDGSRILYSAGVGSNHDIYMMNVDGSNKVRLTHDPANEWGPAWSPDGKQIVFSSDRMGKVKLFLMNADGSNQVQFTRSDTQFDTEDWQPSFSPDGKLIAYAGYSNETRSSEIYVVQSDSALYPRNLTNTPSLNEWSPSWSPDSRRIGFESAAIDRNEVFWVNRELGVAQFLLQAAILMGLLLLVVRRWSLPFGSFTLVLTANAALLSVLNDTYALIAPVFIASLIIDVLYNRLKPSPERPAALRWFAFATPLIYYGVYFLALAVLPGQGIGWNVHMVAGMPVMTGLVGLLLSFLVVPPPKAPQSDVRDAA
jgi:Tol biopolymer transport system component